MLKVNAWGQNFPCIYRTLKLFQKFIKKSYVQNVEQNGIIQYRKNVQFMSHTFENF